MVSLKELCERLGVTRRSIQGYEKVGLLQCTDKNKYGYLLYDETAVQRAEKIRFFQKIGFSLREIKDIIDAPNEVQKEALQERAEVLEQSRREMEGLLGEIKKRLELI